MQLMNKENSSAWELMSTTVGNLNPRLLVN